MVTSKEIVNREFDNVLKPRVVKNEDTGLWGLQEDEIKINTNTFNYLMKLVYMFVPADRIAELEEMIDERNKKLEKFLYEKSISS